MPLQRKGMIRKLMASTFKEGVRIPKGKKKIPVLKSKFAWPFKKKGRGKISGSVGEEKKKRFAAQKGKRRMIVRLPSEERRSRGGKRKKSPDAIHRRPKIKKG